jgi:hypothetical protein
LAFDQAISGKVFEDAADGDGRQTKRNGHVGGFEVAVLLDAIKGGTPRCLLAAAVWRQLARHIAEHGRWRTNAFDLTEAAASQVRQWRKKPLCVRGAISAG